jgi:hypothetical protein
MPDSSGLYPARIASAYGISLFYISLALEIIFALYFVHHQTVRGCAVWPLFRRK